MSHLWARGALGAPCPTVSLIFGILLTSGVRSLLKGLGKEEKAVA